MPCMHGGKSASLKGSASLMHGENEIILEANEVTYQGIIEASQKCKQRNIRRLCGLSSRERHGLNSACTNFGPLAAVLM